MISGLLRQLGPGQWPPAGLWRLIVVRAAQWPGITQSYLENLEAIELSIAKLQVASLQVNGRDGLALPQHLSYVQEYSQVPDDKFAALCDQVDVCVHGEKVPTKVERLVNVSWAIWEMQKTAVLQPAPTLKSEANTKSTKPHNILSNVPVVLHQPL